MDAPLRKTHVYIWVLIALIVPVIIFFSVKNIPSFPQDEHTNKGIIGKQPVINTVTHENFTISFRGKNNVASQIEIKVNKPIKASSAILYTLNNNNDKGDLLGTLSGKGSYLFDLNGPLRGILIYDQIKDREIKKIVF